MRFICSLLQLTLGTISMIGCVWDSAYAMDSAAREKIFTALNRGTPHVKNEMLVQFSFTASTLDKARVLDRIRAKKLETISGPSARTPSVSSQGDLDRLLLPVGLTVADAIRSVEMDSSVVFAEPNWIYQHQAISDDTFYVGSNGNFLWGMYGDASSPANQYGSQAAEAWARDKTGSNAVYVGIIDEGYMYTHEDLAANAGTNPGETAGNGIDDDGNGYIDDVYGWDFAGNNNTIFDGTSDDHGTHVAGTIGAKGGNGKGVAGICWSVKLLNAKFLGNQGGTTANAIKAVDYFTDLKTRHDLNLVATNNSWGGGGFSQSLKNAIDNANTEGILFIAAAGNNSSNNDATASYPASYTSANIIAVASIASDGKLSSFSNFGATTVDLGAPGSGIWSTIPTKKNGILISGYASYSGTSMATPHVTGAAALYKAQNSSATAAQIRAAILGATVSTTSLSGKSVSGGRLNVSGF